jgi:hypothetical protein
MIATDLSADARRIADLLSAVPRGELITYAGISAAIGRDVRVLRHLIYAAMRVAERESGAVFASERGKGYRRLAPTEIVRIGATARARIRGVARRGKRSISAGVIGANDLGDEDRRKILAEQSALGLLEHVARDRSLPVLTPDDSRPLPVAQAARSFMRHIGALKD